MSFRTIFDGLKDCLDMRECNILYFGASFLHLLVIYSAERSSYLTISCRTILLLTFEKYTSIQSKQRVVLLTARFTIVILVHVHIVNQVERLPAFLHLLF
jgi:hypothetical protein